MKRYNHAFTLAFEVHTDNDSDSVTDEELMAAITDRLNELRGVPDAMVKACDAPFDTLDNAYEPGWDGPPPDDD